MRVALIVAVALLAAACSGETSHDAARTSTIGSEPPATSKPFTAAERRWLAKFGAWDAEYGRIREDAQAETDWILSGTTTQAEYRRAVRPLRRCRQRLYSTVGVPPTPELHAVYELLVRACAGDIRLASKSGQPGIPEMDAFNAGKERYERARSMLERRLLVNQALPRAGGRSNASRVESRFSRAASRVIGKRVEVRCWSLRDWRRVVDEYLVFTGYPGTSSAGFAVSGRANLSPDACSTLVAAIYDRRWAASPRERVSQADAVELLGFTAERIAGPEQFRAQTQCYAMQDISRLAHALGARPLVARQLATSYWIDLYAYQPVDYRDPECKNRGEFDKNPRDEAWP
jgi:hypothetical protein